MNKTIPNAKRLKAAEMHRKGASEEALTKFLKCHPATTKRLIKKIDGPDGNVELPPRGGDRRSPDNLAAAVAAAGKLIHGGAPVDLDDIVRMWKDDFKIERHRERVRAILKENNLKLPRKNGRKAERSDSRKPVKEYATVKAGFLTPKERYDLGRGKKRKEVPERVRQRYRVILKLDEGLSVKFVAGYEELTVDTIYNWHRMYREGGIAGISHWGYAGQQRNLKLSPEQSDAVSEYVTDNPTTNLRVIRAWILENLSVAFSTGGVHRMIRKLGFHYRRSKLLPQFSSIEKQQEFIDEINAVIQSLDEDNSVLVYVDGFHPRLQGETGGCWVKEGEVPAIQQSTGREGMNFLAALNIFTGQTDYVEDKYLNRLTVIKLYEKLVKAYPDRNEIHVALDNVKYHKANDVTKWLNSQNKDGPKIVPHYLPPYSPHLNLIERLWKKFRDAVTRNRVQKDLKQFKKESRAFMDSVQSNWEQLRTYIVIELKPMSADQYRNVGAQ